MPDYGLGRLPAPDTRDAAYPMLSLLPRRVPDLKHRYWWAGGWWGDQNGHPQCVAYAWTHWLEDGPVTQRGAGPIVLPADVYRRAQEVDEWPGSEYDGTSVRAGAKVLVEEGLISEYRWATDAATVVHALLTVGPVVVGTDWHEGMFTPDAEGLMRPEGPVVGGHAYLLNGVNIGKGLVRVKNSWGREWGVRGHAWMRINDLDRLIVGGGEACLAVEYRRG